MIEHVMQWRPVRAYLRFSNQRGPIFAQSMALQAFLSIFAALFIAFAIFTSLLGDNVDLRDAVVTAIANSVPGLIDQGSGGAINVDDLLSSSIVGWAGIVAAFSILFTAISWIAVTREGFRAMFDLPVPRQNAVLLKLTDLLVAIGIGVLVLVSAGGVVLTSGVASTLGLTAWTNVLVVIAQLVLDTSIMLLLYRFGGHLRLPFKSLFPAAVSCALAFFVLKLFASALLGGAGRNPLLASIATVVALLIWFGFISQIQLLALAFVAVGQRGKGYAKLEAALAEDRSRHEQQQQALEEAKAAARENLASQREASRDDPAAIGRRLRKAQRKRMR